MRGDILHFDNSRGLGMIGGDDGSRYPFSRSDVRQPDNLAKAARVEFVTERGQAREIARVRGHTHAVSVAEFTRSRKPGLWRYFRDGITRDYANFSGRAHRKEYWSFSLFWLVALAIVACVGFVFDGGLVNPRAAIEAPVITLTLSAAFMVATFLPALGLAIRRQHDIGLSGWYSLLGPVLFAFSFVPSQKHDNKWGPAPEITS